jgi:TolB-like protein
MVLAFTVRGAIGLWMMRACLPEPHAMPGDGLGGTGSIAVLPFLDLSDDGRREDFAEGVAAQIRSALTQTRALPVSGRPSSAPVEGRASTIAAVAHNPGVSYVLEGSVRNSGRHLRVSAELVKADNGFLVWSGTYDRDLDDTLPLQDEVACVVIDGLKASLLPAPAGAQSGHACSLPRRST